MLDFLQHQHWNAKKFVFCRDGNFVRFQIFRFFTYHWSHRQKFHVMTITTLRKSECPTVEKASFIKQKFRVKIWLTMALDTNVIIACWNENRLRLKIYKKHFWPQAFCRLMSEQVKLDLSVIDMHKDRKKNE